MAILVKMVKLLVVLGVMLPSISVFAGDYQGRDDVNQFIEEMVTEHQFSRAEMESWFAQAKKKQSILDAISRPAEKD